MIIYLYKTLSPYRKANKELTDQKEIRGTLKDGSSLMDPVIDVVSNKEYVNYNYAYIPEFKRYYFFNVPVQQDTNSIQTLRLHVDVLTSAWEQIKPQTVMIGRCSNKYNLMIPDEKMQREQTTSFNKYVTPSPFKDAHISIAVTAQNCYPTTVPKPTI